MRFDFVRQKDSMQCGVAALTMISRHFGANCDIDYLSRFCFPTNQGVSLKGIADAARQIGLKTSSARVSLHDLADMPLPCILHWEQNHFVVLYKVSKDRRRYWIADPAKGKYVCNAEDMKSHWVSCQKDGRVYGIAMFFGKTADFDSRKAECVNHNKHTFRPLAKHLSGYRKHLLIIGLSLLVASALQLVLPFLTQWIVDIGVRNKDIRIIWLILLGEFMIVMGKMAADFVRRRLILHVSMRVNLSLLSDFFIKLLRLPMSFFDTKLMGDLLQRMSDHGRVQSFLTSGVLNLTFSSLSFVVLSCVLFVYNKLVFVVFIGLSLLYGLWIAAFLRRRKVLDYELFHQQSKNNNCTYQFITSMQEIKLQDCEQRRRREWEDTQIELFGIQQKTLKLQQTQEAGSIFINEVKNIVVTVLAATAVINGQMTLGAMLAVQYIIGQFNAPVEQLISFINSLQDVKISLERINEIHHADNEEPATPKSTTFAAAKNIRFEHVGFRYDKHAPKNTVDDITFEIPAGKVTAIVGASGSGKTTLIRLMLGYYPVASGEISIAGRCIGDYNLKWWRRHCGVVMQDGVIFSEPIARNIAVSDEDIDRDRLEAAARIANIHDHIMSLPLKYDTKVGRDGVGLSQGQRQRILIARAVYKNPDFIFLDEATNALDAKNEREIVENLDRFYRGRTVVVVAHRLSTVRNADRIVVLDRGRVVETGTHDFLTARRGIYYNLVKNQLELGA